MPQTHLAAERAQLGQAVLLCLGAQRLMRSWIGSVIDQVRALALTQETGSYTQLPLLPAVARLIQKRWVLVLQGLPDGLGRDQAFKHQNHGAHQFSLVRGRLAVHL